MTTGEVTSQLSKENRLVKISDMGRKGEGKMSYFRAISLNSISNEFCSKMSENPDNICHYCYSKRLLNTVRKSIVPALQHNTELLTNALIERHNINATFRPGEYVRLLAHGELVNDISFRNFCQIASWYPYVNFIMWTKRIDIVTRLHDIIPSNLKLIYSDVKINRSPEEVNIPEYFNGVFRVYTKDYVVKNNVHINCNKKCCTCLRCYRDIQNGNVVINELVNLVNNPSSDHYEVK